jgi:hypothetical protein
VAPALIVTLNGVRLRPGDDYTATNGTSLTLVSAAALNDELVVDAFGSFLVANTYTIAEVDAFAVKLTGNQSIAGNKNFAGNTLYVDDTNDRVGVGTGSPTSRLHVQRTSGTTESIGLFESATGGYTGTSLIAANTLGPDSAYNLFSCISDSDADAGGPYTEFRVRGDGLMYMDSGYGSAAPAYGCRAWVRKNSGHDGLGNGIMGSANVSSLTQQSTGRWTVNLSNAMPDTNYAVIATSFRNDSDSLINEDYSIRSTTTFTLNIHNISIPPNRYDFGFSAIVVR